MNCEALKAKHDQLEATIAMLRSEGDTQQQLKRLSAEAWELAQEYSECMADYPGVQTIIDLNGNWASGGVPGPVITVTGNSLAIDMSVYGRPTARGAILDNADIWATFPDDDSYTGKLQAPGEIIWSNNSAWTKL
jgi:hypothetical protein